MTTRIVGKAFLDAYRQAAANSGRAPAASAAARQAASGAPGTSSRTMELNRQTGMNLDEAIKILNLNDPKANPSHLIKVSFTIIRVIIMIVYLSVVRIMSICSKSMIRKRVDRFTFSPKWFVPRNGWKWNIPHKHRAQPPSQDLLNFTRLI